ncbi:retrovirus-related pol polyprotein from transposon TNT 1-94 [Tanacetum coccineum]|uniref:Retrovirus-related pol polyprotein from transposon TNT 1-94 n=1 Tax=Tanacetum coccineum TaxID=301880 RepID=A0ABQ4YZ23_9ASTR
MPSITRKALLEKQSVVNKSSIDLSILSEGFNEPSSSKLVPKVVPLAVKTATSRQELELLFHHQIAMLRTTGMVDNTLFTKKKSSNLIIVQIYVDDIIFGSTCQDMCDEFAKILHDEFEMNMMGELNFFLGLQIKQMEDGIFFNQSKYINEMIKKFGLEDSKPMKTLMSSDTKLTKDEECKSVDSTKYRGMIDGKLEANLRNLAYGCFWTLRLFKHVVSVFPELAIDCYISHDRVMHLLAPHYKRKTQSDRGKKRPRESNASSSSTTLNHPSSSHPLDDPIDENDDESFHSNPSSPSQNISSSLSTSKHFFLVKQCL